MDANMTDAEILAIGKILIFYMNNVPLIILNSNFTQNRIFSRRIGEYPIIFFYFLLFLNHPRKSDCILTVFMYSVFFSDILPPFLPSRI